MRKILQGVSLKTMNKWLKKEKDPKARNRLIAWIKTREGKTVEEIADHLKVPPATVNSWQKRADRGRAGLYDRKPPGAKCKLDAEQLKQLDADLDAGAIENGFEAGTWTGALMTEHIRRQFGVEYSPRSVLDLAHRMGFSRSTPRPVNPKKPSRRVINKFKKKVQRKVNWYHARGYKPFIVDQRHAGRKVKYRKGWHKKGTPPEIAVGFGKGFHMSIFGALAIDGCYRQFYEAANMRTFEEFVRELHVAFGPLFLVLDNATYHSKKLLARLKEEGLKIAWIFLPPYCPELSPIEIQWREDIRCLANRVFDEDIDMIIALVTADANGDLPVVKLSDWYVPAPLKQAYAAA